MAWNTIERVTERLVVKSGPAILVFLIYIFHPFFFEILYRIDLFHLFLFRLDAQSRRGYETLAEPAIGCPLLPPSLLYYIFKLFAIYIGRLESNTF